MFYLEFLLELLLLFLHHEINYLWVLVILDNGSFYVWDQEVVILFWPDIFACIFFFFFEVGKQKMEVLPGTIDVFLCWYSNVFNGFVVLDSGNIVAAPSLEINTFKIFPIIL